MQSALVKLSRHVQRLRAEADSADTDDANKDSEMKQDDEDEVSFFK
jgi:hypothetical protein